MNFYDKDRRFRKSLRKIHKKRSYGIVAALVLCILVSGVMTGHEEDIPRIPVSEGKNHFQDSEPENEDTEITVQKPSSESDIKGSIDKSPYFPDFTPAEGKITDGYGPRIHPEPSVHYAIDIASDFASPIYAAADGEVIMAGSDNIYGLNVVIDHIYDGYKTKYAHMCTYVVTVGQKVKKGEIIGFMGSTGYSTGVHLHYEVIKNDKRLDPAGYMKIKDGRAVMGKRG